MRKRLLLCLVAIVSLAYLWIRPAQERILDDLDTESSDAEITEELSQLESDLRDSRRHQLPVLLRRAHLQGIKRRRDGSRTLASAVSEYRRRYGRAPPAGFDDWYRLAASISANIDEYDTIQESLAPFWALEPADIRSRQEALARNATELGRVRVRWGRVILYSRMTTDERGEDNVARKAFEAMLKEVYWTYGIKSMPDVDLFVNGYDEPRVALDYKSRKLLLDLTKRRETVPFRQLNATWRDIHNVNDTRGRTSAQVLATICPDISPPARSARYVLSHHDALDTCAMRNLDRQHGFYVRPATFKWTEQLLPVFSQAKIAGMSDIIIPGWARWYGWFSYDPAQDSPWSQKTNKVYWRGSASGGWVIGDEYRRWLRPRAVTALNALHGAERQSLVVTGVDSDAKETLERATADLSRDYTDVALTNPAGHGDSDDREAMRHDSRLRYDTSSTLSDQFQHQLVADFDGYGSSGRFISLLQSQSAVLRSRLFIDWTDDITIPWLHYLPLSVSLTEVWHILAHFFGLDGAQGPGSEDLARIARSSRKLANDWLRKDDQVVYAYRLVLEWARVLHDGRDRGEADYVLRRGEGQL